MRRQLKLLDVLPRFAVTRRFGLHDGKEWTVDRIAAELKCTPAAAGTLIETALNAMRSLMELSHEPTR